MKFPLSPLAQNALYQLLSESNTQFAEDLLTKNLPNNNSTCFHEDCDNESIVTLFGFSLCKDHAHEVLEPVKHQIKEIFDFKNEQ